MKNTDVAMLAESVYQLAAKSTRMGKWEPKGDRAFQILTKAALDLNDLATEGDPDEAGDLFCIRGCGNKVTHFEKVDQSTDKVGLCNDHALRTVGRGWPAGGSDDL